MWRRAVLPKSSPVMAGSVLTSGSSVRGGGAWVSQAKVAFLFVSEACALWSTAVFLVLPRGLKQVPQ